MPPPRPARVWTYGLRRVCAAWGMARSSFYAMTSGSTPSSRRAKRRGPKPAISDQALAGGDRSRPGGIALGGRGLPQGRRLGFGSVGHPGCPQAGAPPDAREQSALAPSPAASRGTAIPDGEIITHAPNLMWGTDGVRVFTVDDGWGSADLHRRRALERRVCRLACLQARRPLRRPAADLHGASGLYGSTAAGAARGLALRMDHGSRICRTTSPTRSSSGASSRPILRRRAPDQRRRRAVQSPLKEQIIHGRIYRNTGAAGRRPRHRRTVQCAQWIVENNGS